MNLSNDQAEIEALKLIQLLIQSGHYKQGTTWDKATAQIVADAQTLTKGLAGRNYDKP